MARKGEGDGGLRGVLARLRRYSLTEGEVAWAISPQLDKLPNGRQKWVAANGAYLFSTNKEDWARNREKLRLLDDKGGRPIANIVARDSGLRAKDAPPANAGGILRRPYI